MKKMQGMLALGFAFALGLTGCIVQTQPSGGEITEEAPAPREDREVRAPEGTSLDGAVLEPPMSQQELEPLLAQAYEGLYEGLIVLRRGDMTVEGLYDYATAAVIEQQLRVFGSSVPHDYTIDGFYRVVGVEVPNAWEGTAITAHLCMDDSHVRLLDEEGMALEREPGNTFTGTTVLFELSEDSTRFLVADIFTLFPDAPNPCPAE